MNIINKFTQSKFVRNVIIVASGTAMSQVIGVIFTPVITRIYGPEAFGLMGTFDSIATIAAGVSALTYPAAIVLPKNDNEAKNIVRVAMYISIVLASLAVILIIAGGDNLFALFNAQTIAAFGLLIPLYMHLSSWLKVEQQWLIRTKKFKSTAKILVIKSLILNLAKTIIGLFKPIAAVLIVITTMGIGLQAFMMRLSIRKADKKNQKTEDNEKSNLTSLFQTAKKYYDFPLYRAPVEFIEIFTTNLPVLVLSATFGPISGGFYALGVKLLKAPSRLIGKSVTSVFYPKITSAAHKGQDLQKLIINTTLGLIAAGFLPYMTVICFGPWIFKIVFGTEWVTAGHYARWIAFMIYLQFIARPSSVAIITIGLQRGFLIYEVISTAFKITGLYIGFTIFKNDVTAVALFSVIGAISFLVLMAWVIITSKHSTNIGRFSDTNDIGD